MQGCDLNIVNEDEDTALFLAIKRYDKEVAELLLEAKANPNIANEDKETCLHYIFKLREKAVDETSESLLTSVIILIHSKQLFIFLFTFSQIAC